MLTEAWTLGSVDYGAGADPHRHTCMLALLADEELRRWCASRAGAGEDLAEDLRRSSGHRLAESARSAAPAAAPVPGARRRAAAGGKTPNLDQFTVDLTERAQQGKIDPVLGRDFEIRQVVDILTRRRQNNPILTGEAGVGKTAVVEGFALRIASGDVPRRCATSPPHARPGAAAGRRRRQGRVREPAEGADRGGEVLADADHPVHRRGAHDDRRGRAGGAGDAANLLKPALARGELRTIAATTWSEYKKYFEKDPALARRFQLVKVEEPSEDKCMVMMRGIVPALEKHHNVRILDEGVAPPCGCRTATCRTASCRTRR
jgi:type VI secretion system protein VasG